jgi:NAD(P)-dependent dehydrogenase (short-subunit alcohol dehydrogenase family)
MGLLDGRTAIVTGAGRGIGREFALSLAAEGAAVVVNDVGASLDGTSRDGDPADRTCRDIRDRGGRAVAARHSVTDHREAARIVDVALREFGGLDILINNAGIVRDRTLLKMTEDDFDAVLDVHLKGTFNVTRHAAPVMRERGYGRIVNITSSAGLRGNFGQTNYGAAKAGLMGMTFVWALELRKYGVTVNAMAPAGATRMTAALYERTGSAPPPEHDPAHNAALVTYLASERAGQVTGQVFGRTGYGFTLFQTPRQIAVMWRPGGWTPAEVADHFDEVLGQHLQPVGMPAPMGQHYTKNAKSDRSGGNDRSGRNHRADQSDPSGG